MAFCTILQQYPPTPNLLSMINLLICRLQCRGTVLHIVSLYLGARTSRGCSLKPFESPHGGFRGGLPLFVCVQPCPVIYRN